MNQTGLDWCDVTWNPVTGCHNTCTYCYARKFAARFGGHIQEEREHYDEVEPSIHVLNRPLKATRENGRISAAPFPYGFEPTYHRYRLRDCAGYRSKNIAVCNVADLFGPWIPERWIQEILDVCAAKEHRDNFNNFLFLTRYPGRLAELATNRKLPTHRNIWYGTTMTHPGQTFFKGFRHKTFLSIEPITEPVGLNRVLLRNMNWVIVGAMTGQGSMTYRPKREWIEEIAAACQASDVPLFMKDNLYGVMDGQLVQQYPEQLSRISEEDFYD